MSASSTRRTKESIVEQILEQGQRLRNAMVKAILDCDPLYIDESVLKAKKENVRETIDGSKLNWSNHSLRCNFHSLCEICSKDKQPRNTSSIFKYHECQSSHNNNFREFIKKPLRDACTSTTNEQIELDLPANDITKSIQDSYRSKAAFYFKFVNSLKITLFALKLNQAGNRKVNTTSVDAKYKVPISVSHNYFVEFALPDTITNAHGKSGYSKVDSGLNTGLFRVCSKRLDEEEIHLKHTSIHDIENLLNLDLKQVEIVFHVSCRTMKQKNTNIIGYARFNLGSFEVVKHLSCNQDVPIIDDEGFCYGSLKLSLQLGCGRMYFGKEFVDFVASNLSNVEMLHCDSNISTSNTPIYTERSNTCTSAHGDKENTVVNKNKINLPIYPIVNKNKVPTSNDLVNLEILKNHKHATTPLNSATSTAKTDELLLFGLVYISEAQYFKKSSDTYLSCQVFCQGDTLCSRVVYNNKHPVFNFYQKVPFLLDDAFLSCLRDNSIRVDFWERCEDEDVIFGTTLLPLHQLYASYKNRDIVAALIQNKLPVTISDWWEPICSPLEGDLCGQIKILVALGSSAQIQNLEIERGIKDLSYQVKYVPLSSKLDKSQESSKKASLFRRPNYLRSNNILSKPRVNKQAAIVQTKNDIGVQSDLDNMDSNSKDNSSIQGILETFLSQLQEQKTKNIHVENATNTDLADQNDLNRNSTSESLNKLNECRNVTNMHLQKTSDLLDYLNDALSGDSKSCTTAVPPPPQNTNSFKAQVVIDCALHLPKKVGKTRKNRKKYGEVPPSCYVTFETASSPEVKTTPIVRRSTSPKWEYSCEVLLPTDLLSNNQKRLIFKIWSKNDNLNHPNLQTDIVLGFAALDLTVLASGLPSVKGWFNIIDFTSKCNGQIMIHVEPLENIRRSNNTRAPAANNFTEAPIQLPVQSTCETEPKELLSRALKRKFTQLDEITQRLRVRLADVTKDDSDLSNDGFSDDFERDINTSAEIDHNMIDLSSTSSKSDQDLANSSIILETTSKTQLQHFVSEADRELIQGKQRIDSLLEKLSLLTNEPENSFSNRYVSGCSLQQNNEESHAPNIFKQLHLFDIDSIPSLTELSDISAKSSQHTTETSSVSAKLSLHRHAPDGAGNSVDDSSNS